MGVLIVDDAAFMRMTIRKILTENNISVVGEAGDGMDAIRKYNELKPSVVTMDITMPNLDGIGAVKEIIKLDPHAKVIICSAMGQEPMVIDAIRAGAKGFIVKPISSKKLVDEINKLINL